MRDTWGPPATGWPSFCGGCHRRRCACPPSMADIADADAVVMPAGPFVSRSQARRLAALAGEDVEADSLWLDG